jgi:hypothetical protein
MQWRKMHSILRFKLQERGGANFAARAQIDSGKGVRLDVVHLIAAG